MTKSWTFRLSSQGVAELKRDLEALGEKGKRVFDALAAQAPGMAQGLNKAETAIGRARRELEELARRGAPGFKATAAAGQELSGVMQGLAARVPVVGGALSALGPVGLAAGAALGGIGIAAAKGFAAFGEMERSVRRLDSVLRAAGGGIGVTRKELQALQQQLKATTFFGDGDVRQAQAALALNRGVRGEAFKETIRLAADLSEVLGGDLTSAAITLGKAWQDPVKGLTALRKAGLDFGDAATVAITRMAEAGNIAGAQARLFDELRASIGGAAAGGHGGAAGAVDDLKKSWDDLIESFGGLVAQAGVTEFFGTLARGARGFAADLAGVAGAMDAVKQRSVDFQKAARELSAAQAALQGNPNDPALQDRERYWLGKYNALLPGVMSGTAGAGAQGPQMRDFRAAAGEGDRAVLAELKEKKEAQEELAKAQDELVAKMAEELRLAKLSARERFIEASVAKQLAEFEGKRGADLAAFTAKAREYYGAIYDAGKAQEEATRAQAESTRELERAKEQHDQAVLAIEDQIAGLADEREQLKMTERERFVHNELLKAEAQIRKGLIKDGDAYLQRVRSEAGTLFDSNAAKEGRDRALEDQKRETERAEKERERELERAADRQAEIMQRPFANALEGIQGQFADTFTAIFNREIVRFSDFAAGIRGIFARLAGELATLMDIRPVVGGLLGSVGLGGIANQLGLGSVGGQSVGGVGSGTAFGGGTSGSGFGLSSLSFGGLLGNGSGIGTLLFGSPAALAAGGSGPSSVVASTSGLFGSGGGGQLGAFLNAPIGGGLASGLLAFGGSLLSGQGILQSGITAGLTGIGTVLGGPLGGAIGGLLGSVVGGLFGKKKPKLKKNEAEAWLKSGPFGFPVIDYTDTDGKVPGGMGNDLGKAARRAVTEALAGAGATLDDATRLRLSYYHSTKGGKTKSEFYKATMFADLAGLGLNNISGEIARYASAEDALRALSAGALFASGLQGNIAGTGASTQAAFRYLYTGGGKTKGSMDNVPTDVAEVLDVVNFTKWIDGFDKVRTAGDASRKALDDLNASMAKLNNQADELGIDLGKVTDAVRRDFTESVQGELLQLTDPQAFALAELEKEFEGRKAVAIKLGIDLVELEKLYGLKRQQVLDQNLQGIAGSWKAFINGLQFGELSALSPADQLANARAQYEASKGVGGATFREAASTYLGLQRQAYGSTQSFADLYAEVIALAKQFGGISDLPGFAAGGEHKGGWRIVGERGPELEATGAARYFSHAQTAAMFQGIAAGRLPGWLTGQGAANQNSAGRRIAGGDEVVVNRLAPHLASLGSAIDRLAGAQERNNREQRMTREQMRQR